MVVKALSELVAHLVESVADGVASTFEWVVVLGKVLGHPSGLPGLRDVEWAGIDARVERHGCGECD